MGAKRPIRLVINIMFILLIYFIYIIQAKLAGVIERLAYQTGDAVGIEIRPSQSIQVVFMR